MKDVLDEYDEPIRLEPNSKVTPEERLAHTRKGRRVLFEKSEPGEPFRLIEDSIDPVDRSNSPLPSGERYESSQSTIVPSNVARRAMQEFESGSLDELLIYKLLSVDRKSSEFREKYIKLRIESMTRPRKTGITEFKAFALTPSVEAQKGMRRPELESPLRIDGFRYLWAFFGPQLIVLIALKIFYSCSLATLLGNRGVLVGNHAVHVAALIIFGISLLISTVVIRQCRGRNDEVSITWLLGIGVLDTIIALASFLGPEFL